MRCGATQRNAIRDDAPPPNTIRAAPAACISATATAPAIASASVTAARAAGRLDALRRIRCNACRPRADRCARRHAYETPFLYTRAAML
ncbi:hypothetical protein T210_0123945 [Burkholderia pseudomallei MSHR6137]|nr:hypothetical protein T210_0123945 [Burkholderia pseudomallei MSHR6137]